MLPAAWLPTWPGASDPYSIEPHPDGVVSFNNNVHAVGQSCSFGQHTSTTNPPAGDALQSGEGRSREEIARGAPDVGQISLYLATEGFISRCVHSERRPVKTTVCTQSCVLHPKRGSEDIRATPSFDLALEEEQLPDHRLVQLAFEGHLSRLSHARVDRGRPKSEVDYVRGVPGHGRIHQPLCALRAATKSKTTVCRKSCALPIAVVCGRGGHAILLGGELAGHAFER